MTDASTGSTTPNEASDAAPTDAAATDADAAAGLAEPDNDDYEQLNLTDLTNRRNDQQLTTPLANPPLLPLDQLEPPVLERVAAELVSVGNHLSVQFYGRSGQKQHGLDIVEYLPSRERTVYQVKRFGELTPTQLAAAVREFAGSPKPKDGEAPERRFAPTRFVLVTSAKIDHDTALADKIRHLQDDYSGDLDIAVWGAEALSRKLRYLPFLVYAAFGESWAKEFCGYTRDPTSNANPDPLGLIDDPINVLGLTSLYREAVSRAEDKPAEAAGALAAIADELDLKHFPGRASAVRRYQADLLVAAGRHAEGFEVYFRLGLNSAIAGNGLATGSFAQAMASAAEEAGEPCVTKQRVLHTIDRWTEDGSVLAVTVPGLESLASTGDLDVAVLTCLVIEQAVVDGLYDTDPPQIMVGDVGDDAPDLLVRLRDLADGQEVADPVLRARLRCAVADSRIGLLTTASQASDAYQEVLDVAAAGFLRGADGLVPSRAARALAAVGDLDRARMLWSQAVRRSGESGLHGDTRGELLALRMLRREQGQPPTSAETTVSSLPNRQRLLGGNDDAAGAALSALRGGNAIEAFGSIRQALWEARLAGHWFAERVAISYFADLLVDTGRLAAATETYVTAGDQKKATKVAAALPELVDVTRWLQHGSRSQRVTAASVIGAQAAKIADADVVHIVDDLLAATDGYWTSSVVMVSPQKAAIRAVAAFGLRIPDAAVDRILTLIQAGPAHGSTDVADLLVNTYYAVPARRSDLAPLMITMLDNDNPPHNLAALIASLPEPDHTPLVSELGRLATEGRAAAGEALGQQISLAPAGQLIARRAIARLLRRPSHVDRNIITITTSFQETARLAVFLTQVDEIEPVVAEQLTPAQCQPVGGTILVQSRVSTVGERPPEVDAMLKAEQPPTAPGDDEIDDIATAAIAEPVMLLALVFDRLVEAATDPTEGAEMRAMALGAIASLLPNVGADRAAAASNELLAVSIDPQFNENDLLWLRSNDPLSRFRFEGAQTTLANDALVVAASAFAHVYAAVAFDDDAQQLANKLAVQAAGLVRSEDPAARRSGARTIGVLGSTHPTLAAAALALLLNHDPDVRAEGIPHAPATQLVIFIGDPAPQVRARVAARIRELDEPAQQTLLDDADVGVRRTARQTLDASLGVDNEDGAPSASAP